MSQLFGSQSKSVNLKLQLSAASGSGTLDLNFTDGAGSNSFSGTITSGQVLWTPLTLKPGTNTFTLNSPSTNTVSLTYELWLYDLPAAPASWTGVSGGQIDQWQSRMLVSFPQSGLYEFNFDLTAGRYQFLLDMDYVQKTVETPGTVRYYVAAGTHELRITPDSTKGTTAWGVSITAAGVGEDGLPYAKAGGQLGGSANDFRQEWLPLKLGAATPANFKLTLSGADSDAATVYLYSGTASQPSLSLSEVHGGESLWWSSDLPAGVSRVQVVAAAGNTGRLSYEFALEGCPAAPASWAGSSAGAAGNHSQVRFRATQAGLYDFSYSLGAGRYQFLIDAGNPIQKTVEGPGSVRYYLPAGEHTLSIVQDAAQASTAWTLSLAPAGIAADSLPYSQRGGRLGGSQNAFARERLPLQVASGGPANFRLKLSGAGTDGLVVRLQQGLAATTVYTTPVVYGGEIFWWTAELAGGLNQLELLAQPADAQPLQYELTVDRILPTPGDWAGIASSSGGNSVARLQLAGDGTYRVRLATAKGFAQVLLDQAAPKPAGTPPAPVQATQGHVAEFDVPLSAGAHNFLVRQSAAYITTTWSVSVTASVAGPTMAHFSGGLESGAKVDPQLPLFATQDQEVNFQVKVPAGSSQMAVTVADPAGGTAFSGVARAGETLWGTAKLRPGQNTFTFQNTGAATLSYDVTVYAVGKAPHSWAGVSHGAGTWDSQIKLNFPQSGLYTFDLGRTAGRYQFQVDDDYLLKTVESGGSAPVSYYVSAGTHVLKVIADSASAGTEWTVGVSAVGAGSDSLPYAKAGGQLGGKISTVANDFRQEWLPLKLGAATPANFKLKLSGAASDMAAVHLYTGTAGQPSTSITQVHGGETVWWTSDLPAGISRVHVVAETSNASPLQYELTVEGVPALSGTTSTVWAGSSAGAASNNSRVRFTAPSAGLYGFTYSAGSERYQFLIDGGNPIQKTVEGAGSVQYYLPAGEHDLTIVQDPAKASTSWSVSLQAAGKAADTLPYAMSGGQLGGSNNPFVRERLPLQVTGGGPANFKLKLNGAGADGLVVQLKQGAAATTVYTTPVVYSGETFWWTAELAGGLNQLELLAQPGNTAPLQYELTVDGVPTLSSASPHSWAGVSSSTGGSSKIRLTAPVTGTYHVRADYPLGYANVFIADANPSGKMAAQALTGSVSEFDVTLGKGTYVFEVQPSKSFATTSWTVAVSLIRAPAPAVTSVSPAAIGNTRPYVLTVRGSNFQPGATVDLGGAGVTSVTYVDSGTLTVLTAAGSPLGTYDVKVTNPDTQAATLAKGLTVTDSPAIADYRLWLPALSR